MLDYGTVTGRFLAAVADTISDPDYNPDLMPISGTVTFTPSATSLLVVSEDATILPVAIKADLDAQGYISLNGVQGVTLLATDSTNTNPTGFTYMVSFASLRTTDGTSVSYRSFPIQVPTGQTVDLSAVAPVAASGGAAITRGPAGPAGADGAPGGTFTWDTTKQAFTAPNASQNIAGIDPTSNLPIGPALTANDARYIAYKQAAKNPDLLIVGTITRDTNGTIQTAAVTWPDGTTGTFTTDTVDPTGAINGYHISYGTTHTYTQPTITRDSSGAATNVPQITVS